MKKENKKSRRGKIERNRNAQLKRNLRVHELKCSSGHHMMGASEQYDIKVQRKAIDRIKEGRWKEGSKEGRRSERDGY
jgi:hypothetical protein